MNIILNETEAAERLIGTPDLDSCPVTTLRIIARYYLDNGYDKKRTRRKLEDYVNSCGFSPTLNEWSDMMDRAMKKAIKTKAIKISGVKVYKSELEQINTLKGIMEKRLAFTLLCLAKYKDAIKPSNNHWVSEKDSDIMKLANIKTTIKRQGELYRKLQVSELVKFPKKVDSISMQVLFCDDEERDECEILISDFRNLGYQLSKYLGDDFETCHECGLVFKRRSKTKGRPPKYCNECALKIRTQQNIESVIRGRN